ncbi:MAG: imidazole glycerol phosphate synthase subunit HisF [Desulfarculales bacterium]|jgi:cyclase|nr:imidazole glycerol phosphate synthase subunit HisF [Desulfarculales bacterium]
MLSKRIIPCLDVRDGRLTKGVKFLGNADIGDPVEMAARYYDAGADELVFYDITASAEGRGIMLEVVRRVADQVFIPFAVGGGLASVSDMYKALAAGADKVSVNSAAVKNPDLIAEGARQFGSQCIVLGMDVRRTAVSGRIPSGYEVVINGGRTPAGLDALVWAGQGQTLGAGEICLNSIDADGTQNGYELTLTGLVGAAVSIPVIASGGAGRPEHIGQVLSQAQADAALIASMTHYGYYTIAQIKEYLAHQGLPVRGQW